MLTAFFRFTFVGAIAFVVDSSVMSLLITLGGGIYVARAISFSVAVTFSYAINRTYTFGRVGPPDPSFREWLRFVASNSIGGLINFGVYSVIVSFNNVFRQNPVLAVAVGSIAGLCFNFVATRRYVFREGLKRPFSGREGSAADISTIQGDCGK